MAKEADRVEPGMLEINGYYDSIEGLVSVDGAVERLERMLAPVEGNPGGEEAGTAKVLDLEGAGERLKEAHALYEEGLLHNFRKVYDQAVVCLEKAYGLYLELRCFPGSVQCLAELGWLKYNQDADGGQAKAHRLFSEAMKILSVHMHEPGINEARARLLHYQGLVRYREKRYGEAVRHFMYARTFCNPNGLETARIYDSLAVHYERTNDYYRAVHCLEKALEIKKRCGAVYEQAVTCQIMGRIHILREEYRKASEYLFYALRIAREVSDRYRCGRIQNELIRLSIYQNDFDKARQLIREVEQTCQDREMRVLYARSQFYKAYIQYTQLDLDGAKALLEGEVLPIFQKYGYRKGAAMGRRLLACIQCRQGEETRAIEEMSEVIALFKTEGEIAELAKTYYELGRIYLGLHEEKLALASMLEAMRIAESNGLTFIISHIEDEIFRLDERKWEEIVEKRANHDRVFEKETDSLESLSDASGASDEESRESPNTRLVSLLRVGRAMAAERNLDKLLALIKREIELAMDAERCTVFIYDCERNELWSKVATGLDTSEEIRFPAHLGLAGYVVKTGEVLNIKDAYDDPRFNKEIDKQTGYRTHNILCIPMRNRKMEIIGVFQVLNKRRFHFDTVDEELLSAIASSAGVAIENATLAREMKVSFDSFVKTLSSTIDARDPITAGHSERVAEYAVLLGEEMDLPDTEVEALRYASLLHDIGKIGIREDILKKDGRLTEKEYRHIQKHVYYTHEILKNVHFEHHLRMVPEIAASHHEKMDGTGYHRGLKGGDIPLSGRILAIADVFDAITSRRHYRNRMAFDKVLTILKRDAGTHFDPECVENFFEIPLYRLGHVLLMDRDAQAGQEGQQVLASLDRQITVAEYYKCLIKGEMTKGEADAHRIFDRLYHQG